MPESPILIVGAGPTGLNLALALARRNVPHRIISEANGPGEHSRAMVVQARTLEFYGQFGFADEVIAQGVVADSVHIREGGDNESAHEVTSISFRDLGDGIRIRQHGARSCISGSRTRPCHVHRSLERASARCGLPT